MNKNYRSIWNDALGAWVAVSELDSACGKSASSVVTRSPDTGAGAMSGIVDGFLDGMPALSVLTVAAVAVAAGLSAPDEAYAQYVNIPGAACTDTTTAANLMTVAVGCGATAAASGTTAIGAGAYVTGMNATAVGINATASAQGASAFGTVARATGL